MSDTDNVIKNIDRIRSLSQLMGGGGSADTDKLINAISVAKSMGIIGGEQQSGKTEIVASASKEYEQKNEGIRMVKAAIPFLDRDYQKHLFLAVKLLEMNDEFDAGAMSLQCQSIAEGSYEEQREAMLRAIRSEMSSENGSRMDVILKMMEARRLASKVRG